MAPSLWQILIVVLIIVLLFGTNRLPATMENLAKGIKSFKKGLRDEDGDDKASAHAAANAPADTQGQITADASVQKIESPAQETAPRE